MSENPKGLLIAGESGVGKSFSLMNFRGQEGVLYLNCEGGKPLPFKNKFKRITIDDPMEIFGLLQQIMNDTSGRFHTVVIDTVSFMMNRYEAVHVRGAANGQAAWGNYGAFFPELMYDYVAKLKPYVVFLGHNDKVIDENTGTPSWSVPVKGALKRNGIEAYFTTVLVASKMKVKDLAQYEDGNVLLTVTDRDRELGFKHVFQTRTTKQTVGDRIRTPYGLFSDDETYINNDTQIVIDRLTEYYKD